MLGILDRILKLLSVGNRAHSVFEIAYLTGLKTSQVEKAFRLLESIEFAHFDGEGATIDPIIKQVMAVGEEDINSSSEL